MKPETKEWLKKAKEDLDTAEFNLEHNKLNAAAFYAQQAVEKALKALQIERLNKFDKTHDVLALAKSVRSPKRILERCKYVYPFYTATRYPNVKKLYNKEKVKRAVISAKDVIEWVSQTLRL